jgi:predicted NUDIX family phosphoesterase
MSDQDERVLCFPTSRLHEIGYFNGFMQPVGITNKLFDSRLTKFEFLPRSQVETDPSYKQLVTYSVIQYGQTKNDTLIFSYTRGKSGGEDRLKKLKSIGIGGHISEDVVSRRHSIHYLARTDLSRELDYCKIEAMREIEEEVSFTSKKPLLYLCGLINDDSNDVGKVHFGIVYRLLLSIPDCEPREDCIHEGFMTTVNDIKKNVSEYESWSKILIEGMLT